MTTNHTPGPWTVGNEEFGSAVNDSEGKRVANASNRFLPGTSMGRDETLRDYVVRAIDNPTIAANARLIAAAPELLAALQLIDQAHAACVRYADVPGGGTDWRSYCAELANIARAAIARAAIAQAKGEA